MTARDLAIEGMWAVIDRPYSRTIVRYYAGHHTSKTLPKF